MMFRWATLLTVMLLACSAWVFACGGGDDDDDDDAGDDDGGDDDDDDADDDEPPPPYCEAELACIDALIACYASAESVPEIIACEDAATTCATTAAGCFGTLWPCVDGCAGDAACEDGCVADGGPCFEGCSWSASCWDGCMADLETCVVACGPDNFSCTQGCYATAWDECWGGCVTT